MTSSVVESVCVRLPLTPVMVSERPTGTAAVVVFMVRVEDPLPVIEAGLKPPLVMPVGNPDSLATLRLTVPVNPLTGVTVTVNRADWPGTTGCACGVTAIEKSAVAGVTVIVRVGGFGSLLPELSMTVSEAV